MERETIQYKNKQLSLGEIIDKIEKLGLIWERSIENEEKYVCFDFGSAVPTTLDSWRGIYAELAIGYKLVGYDASDNTADSPKASEFLKELKSAIGNEFYGWKGGDFTMSRNTPVWVANSGNSGNTVIVDVMDDGYRIVLLTAYCEI